MLKANAQPQAKGEEGPRPAAGSRRAEVTRAQIIGAAIDTLREQGFGGTTARAIAARGGFNQALIFYHFGGVHSLLMATFEHAAAERLTTYRAAIEPLDDLIAAVGEAQRLHAEDLKLGYISVLAELIAGASSVPDLGPHILRCIEPWMSFAEATIERLAHGTLLGGLIVPRELAVAMVAMYLGMELLDHLDREQSTSAAVFGMGNNLLLRLAPLLGLAPARSRSDRVPRAIPLSDDDLAAGKPDEHPTRRRRTTR